MGSFRSVAKRCDNAKYIIDGIMVTIVRYPRHVEKDGQYSSQQHLLEDLSL